MARSRWTRRVLGIPAWTILLVAVAALAGLQFGLRQVVTTWTTASAWVCVIRQSGQPRVEEPKPQERLDGGATRTEPEGLYFDFKVSEGSSRGGRTSFGFRWAKETRTLNVQVHPSERGLKPTVDEEAVAIEAMARILEDKAPGRGLGEQLRVQ